MITNQVSKEKTSEDAWRNIQVNRDRKFEHLVKELVDTPDTALFRFNKDLMIFGAMLGYNFEYRKPLPTKSEDTIQITLQTYRNTEDDGYIYLLGMLENRHATCLKNENLSETVKIFEEYCNGGLDLLNDWKAEYPTKKMTEILMEKIAEHTQNMQTNHQNVSNEDLEINF